MYKRQIKLTEDGGAKPYQHSKDNKYLIDDLSTSDINNLKYIELELSLIHIYIILYSHSRTLKQHLKWRTNAELN